MRCACLLIVGLLCCVPAGARDLFVNNVAGNDLMSGRTPVQQDRENGPVQTIAKALRLAQPGDRIILADTGEPYRESITVQGGRHSGFEALAPFVIEGSGATIDGLVPIPEEGWEYVARDVFRYAPAIKSHQVLFLDGQPAVRVPTQPGDTTMPPLERLQWCLVRGEIYFRVEPGRVPQQYFPECAGAWTGVTVYDVHNVVIRNLTVRGFAFDGVNAHDNAFNVRLEEVVSRDNGRSGFSVGGASRVRIENCQATHNHSSQLRTEGYSETMVVDTALDETTAPALQRDGGRLVTE